MLSNTFTLPETMLEAVLPLHQVGGHLAYHNTRRVGVARNILRHYRCVSHPQVGHTVHPQFRVCHSSWVFGRTHGTGGHVVRQLVRELAGEALPVGRTVEVRVLTALDRFGKMLKMQSMRLL